MKKTTKKMISILAALLIAVAIPNVTYANEMPKENKTDNVQPYKLAFNMAGELWPGQMANRVFNMPASSQEALISVSSSAMDSSAEAPVTVYIDGAKLLTTNGKTATVMRRHIAAGTRTIQVTNDKGIYLAYALEINYY